VVEHFPDYWEVPLTASELVDSEQDLPRASLPQAELQAQWLAALANHSSGKAAVGVWHLIVGPMPSPES